MSEVKEYDIDKLKKLIKEKDVDKIKQFMKDNDLILVDDVIESKYKKDFLEESNFYDLKQYVTKIESNSSYGALLNTASTFYDFRLGNSITMTGRMVWKHLASKANELLDGEYNYQGKGVVTGDTDSVYMSINTTNFRKMYPNFDYSKDNLSKFSDEIGYKINDTFPKYNIDMFHCTEKASHIHDASREIVASRALVCGKKRYAMLVFDEDGKRTDLHGKPGKIKVQGIQVKRSDTPILIRNLLKDMLQSILVDGSKEKLYEILKEFGKTKWSQLEPWEKGRPKACNKLKFYTDEYNKTGKCSVGQVMASINWNKLIDANNDKTSPKIVDGDKVIVCSLNPNNAYGMKSIAYPLDLNILPKWFKDLPFSEQDMEDSIIDTTLDTVFKAVNWKLRLSDAMRTNDDINDFITFLD